MFAQRDGFGGGSDAGDGAGEESAAAPATSAGGAPAAAAVPTTIGGGPWAGPAPPPPRPPAGLIGEGEGHFDLGVLGERLGARQVDGAARAIHAVGGGAGAQRVARAVAVAHEEIGGVHQDVAVALGGDGEAPQDGLREGIFHRPALGGIGAGRAEVLVALHHQDARADAFEGDDLAVAFLSAVEPDVVGAESGGEAGGVEDSGVEAWDFQEQVAGALVPIQREVAVELLHAGGAFLDGRDARGRLRRRLRVRVAGRGAKRSDRVRRKIRDIGEKTSGNYYTRRKGRGKLR